MKTNRLITKKECPWLSQDIQENTEIYKYNKHTYGCVGDGIAVSLIGEDIEPFLEIPRDAIGFE